jgi:alpha-glucosidase (family GH31 glycosyl hydrolase)
MGNVYGKNPDSYANPGSIVQGKNYRFAVINEHILRMEYSPQGKFVDAETQIILNRKFPVPEYTVKDSPDKLEILTKYLILTYDKKAFSSNGLTVQVVGNPYLRKTGIWFYGDEDFLREGNLLGTATTLDNTVGNFYYRDSMDENNIWGEPDKEVELCYGLLSKNGFSVIDDSHSLIFREDGWVEPSEKEHVDIYFMAYGRDYLGCLDMFYRMSGKTPMLPRFALGNWWSRYYSYTQDEYLALQDRFREEKIPIAVAVLDMGWHYVDIDPKYGKGWTGYSWNRELFPDPAAMMKQLHERGMHVSLNVHPADGVRAHEDMYEEMAKELGVDYEKEIPIPFDVTDPKFMEAYFSCLHHPNEEDGVDFWWLDWQQGSNTRVPGYDPLWMLNHYHYLDNGRSGKRPLDFSRYAGLGSQRYPIGFSGSSFITWESLDFQPYFTANASNVGYGWWSHDIGGHRQGYREDELTTRWVQFGVFSPIMRLHSSDEVFTGKEPWKFCVESERVMRRFLSLRHQLVPYLYTMNELFYRENRPLIQPMYYQNPELEDAYHVKNEYYFGTELIVSPITVRNDTQSRMGSVNTLIPEGVWYDFFTGLKYRGGRMMELYRPIDTIPVLAKAGAIIPMQAQEELSSRTDNPVSMELRIFAGADGTFTLYEDDGVSMEYENGKYCTTDYVLQWGAEKVFNILPAQGVVSLIPEIRRYTVLIYGVKEDCITRIVQNGTEISYTGEYDEKRNVLTIQLSGIPVTDRITICFRNGEILSENNILEHAYEILNRSQIPFATKEKVYRLLQSGQEPACILSTIQAMVMPDCMKRAISELLLA